MRWCFHDCWISWVWYFLLHLAPYIFTRQCMTNTFTSVSSIKFKICSPSGFDPQVGKTKTTRCYTVTHMPLALIFHTPDAYKCKALLYLFFFFFNRIFFSIFCRRSLFWGDTHAHLCVPRCRSNHVLVSNLQTWNQVSRTVTCFTYIASFVLTMGK